MPHCLEHETLRRYWKVLEKELSVLDAISDYPSMIVSRKGEKNLVTTLWSIRPSLGPSHLSISLLLPVCLTGPCPLARNPGCRVAGLIGSWTKFVSIKTKQIVPTVYSDGNSVGIQKKNHFQAFLMSPLYNKCPINLENRFELDLDAPSSML